jgi:hypothetical protein
MINGVEETPNVGVEHTVQLLPLGCSPLTHPSPVTKFYRHQKIRKSQPEPSREEDTVEEPRSQNRNSRDP